MPLQSGTAMLRMNQSLKFKMQLAYRTVQESSRAYRTTARSTCRAIMGTTNGMRTLRSNTLPKFATNSSRNITTRQFTLPNSQIGPIRHTTRPSTPSLLQKTFNFFNFRQKANISTRTRPSPSRIQPTCRHRFSTARSNRKPERNAKSESNDSSLGARMRKLSREYGWTALGVYLMLSALDFPFCYLLVRYLGTDRIGEWEEIVVSYVKSAIPESVKSTWHEWRSSMKKAEMEVTGAEKASDATEMAGWGIEEAQERNKKDASLATQLALAYAIHKSFIFIRVPLAAAVTPRIVKTLRGWGWDIGKKTSKAAKAAKRAEIAEKKSVK